MCENCVWILEAVKHRRQLHMFVETGILIDKLKRKKSKTLRTPDNIAAESVCEAPTIHRRSQ